MSDKVNVTKWEQSSISISKYVRIEQEDDDADEWRGCGKDYYFPLQGNWGELIDLALAILRSENTRLAAPAIYDAVKQLGDLKYSYEFGSKPENEE